MAEAPSTRVILVQEAVLDKNQAIGRSNRAMLDADGSLAVNLLSSPGSGKTTLLERTLRALSGQLTAAVIVGDLATDNDARRIGSTGCPVVQINTADICHLDAAMVSRALGELGRPLPRLVFIENVGNLVCPASFYLGEHRRVALMSVTEGEDKPLKYPTLFRTADLVLITKYDLAEAVEFDDVAALRAITASAPDAAVLRVSAKTGLGMEEWYAWLRAQRNKEDLHGDTSRGSSGIP